MILQGSFAVAAKSEAMIADTLAMSVDAFTYLFNLLAEKLKHTSLWNAEGLSKQELTRRRKEMRLYLELIPPLLSVTALIVVSIQTFKDAIKTIVEEQSSSSSHDVNMEDVPNVNMMLFFSFLNLLLDVMNVTCFSKAKNFSLGGMDTVTITIQKGEEEQDQEDETANLSSDEEHSNRRRVDVESGIKSMSETSHLLQEGSSDTKDCYYGTSSVSGNSSNQQSLNSASESESDDDDLSMDATNRVIIRNNQYISSTARKYKKRKSDVDDDLSEGSDNDYDSDISEALSKESEKGLNLNMCSAYTVSEFLIKTE